VLHDDQITLPSGYAVQQQAVDGGFTAVDLENGGEGRNEIFGDIESGDPTKIDARKVEWQQEGIEYVESTNPAKQYKLQLPAPNMNDVFI
jgi:hypothetical protein